eukprot:CAMPEP_0202444158 /NCGR_PEP_ID=MMETSP1360-20130828/3297_1 /ASSEMBLY_ACC=CAM_ASM_000848 /TAXON_ID=515479 /ORGANISM="Licmophora paradoxa, Strain CCMP2313" /LENGTH=616 /DNA_ID=CAMNT_0049060079 /DNA_START=720 /DNA_END=2571 /DNA_ORIENTATION=+
MEPNFEIQELDNIDANIVKASHLPGKVQTGWKRERGEYFPIKIFLRPHLCEFKLSLDEFMADNNMRQMYISGPPGSGKTTYCLFYFTLYMTNNNKKGLIIQYRSEAASEVMIVEEQLIRRVTIGSDAETTPSLVRSLIRQHKFDFILFDGVRIKDLQCIHIGSVIANHMKTPTKLIKVTSLQFDIKGGDSIGGLDGCEGSFFASSWEYDDYKNAVDAGLLEPGVLERIVCVDSDYEPETDTGDGDVMMEDSEENNRQEKGGVQSEAQGDMERLDWLKSLLPRKHYYAGGSARYMFEYSIDQLTVSTKTKKSIFERISDRMTVNDWKAFAQLNISSSTPASVSSGMQRIGAQYIPVSEYFLHLAHQRCKAELTKSVRAAADESNNPALKGWAFELEQLDVIEHMIETDAKVLVSEDDAFRLPVPSESITYDGIRFKSNPQGNAFTVWCSRWNQGCFDVAFYNASKLITLNFTISSTNSLKLNPLRDLVSALQVSGKSVTSVSHIAIVENKANCNDFKFDGAEGGGKIVEQSLFSVETARSQKLKATISAHLQSHVESKPPTYGHPLKTVTVYPRERTSPRKRKKEITAGHAKTKRSQREEGAYTSTRILPDKDSLPH